MITDHLLPWPLSYYSSQQPTLSAHSVVKVREAGSLSEGPVCTHLQVGSRGQCTGPSGCGSSWHLWSGCPVGLTVRLIGASSSLSRCVSSGWWSSCRLDRHGPMPSLVAVTGPPADWTETQHTVNRHSTDWASFSLDKGDYRQSTDWASFRLGRRDNRQNVNKYGN